MSLQNTLGVFGAEKQRMQDEIRQITQTDRKQIEFSSVRNGKLGEFLLREKRGEYVAAFQDGVMPPQDRKRRQQLCSTSL